MFAAIFLWATFLSYFAEISASRELEISLHSKICLAGAVSTAAEHAREKLREHQRIQGESQPAQEDRQRLQPHPDQDRYEDRPFSQEFSCEGRGGSHKEIKYIGYPIDFP